MKVNFIIIDIILIYIIMDTEQKIDTAQQVLKTGGDVIKTRDDRELILVTKDGKVQNADACNWAPDDEGCRVECLGCLEPEVR